LLVAHQPAPMKPIRALLLALIEGSPIVMLVALGDGSGRGGEPWSAVPDRNP
jgi:hypothetical protein